jgi:hypothetical protein
MNPPDVSTISPLRIKDEDGSILNEEYKKKQILAGLSDPLFASKLD